jgi:hypothetical protein
VSLQGRWGNSTDQHCSQSDPQAAEGRRSQIF